jgi:ribosome-binding factor A
MASPKTIARLEAVIQRRAAHCLQFEVTDPRSGFVTITGVELSPDLAVAKISYSVLGDEAVRSKVGHLLEHATGFVQRQVAGVLRLRRAPQLRFVFDESIAEAARLDQLIREARRRDAEISGKSEDEPDAPDDPAG